MKREKWRNLPVILMVVWHVLTNRTKLDMKSYKIQHITNTDKKKALIQSINKYKILYVQTT